MKKFAAALALSALAGCAVGIQDNGGSPQTSFEVNRNYQTVFARAVDQANACMRGDESGFDGRREDRQMRGSAFEVSSSLNEAARSGEVLVTEPLSGAVMARTRFQAAGAGRTTVTQQVWGRGTWDAKTLTAMRRSIEMDASLCTVYEIK